MVPFAGEATTDGFGVSGVEFSFLLVAESVTGLLGPKMTALNVVKLLPNDTSQHPQIRCDNPKSRTTSFSLQM
jgi:hypothetical protein